MSRPRTLLLHLAGWLALGIVLLLGTLREKEIPLGWALLARAVYLACIFLCSLPLGWLCRALWRRAWPWPKAMLSAAACCLPLGYLCQFTAVVFTSYVGWGDIPSPWELVLYSLGGVTAPFVLILWCGLFFGHKQYERVMNVEALAREAELRALRYQLTPHFLGNTLHGISTLVGEGRTKDARRMIAQLGNFLRATVDGVGTPSVSLEQEIYLMNQYLAIEQIRLGDRLRVDVRVDPKALDGRIPNLLLQPLVENAIIHGITPATGGGTLVINAGRMGEQINLSVENFRLGEGLAPENGPAPQHHDGHGLQNTAKRLQAAYGAHHTLTVEHHDERMWRVAITLPYDPIAA